MLQQALFASRLFATCYRLLFVGYGLSYACFRRVCKGLEVLCTTEHIRLPYRTLCLDNLTCLGQLTELGDSWPGCYAKWSIFWVAYLGLLLDLLYLAHQSAFGHCGSLSHFILNCIVLFDAPYYIGIAMKKGAWNYIGIFFSMVHKLVQAENKLPWVENKLYSSDSRSLYQKY